jgi:hypothetical protein
MGGFTRGTWVRHRPTGIAGRIEVQDAAFASVLRYPPDNSGWFTARAADFEPADASPSPPLGAERAGVRWGTARRFGASPTSSCPSGVGTPA